MSSKKKIRWSLLKSVLNCEHREYIGCPRCGLEDVCYHKKNEEEECCENNCPIKKSKRRNK